MSDCIFESIGQALRIAFEMEYVPASVKSSTQIAIELMGRKQQGNEQFDSASRANLRGWSDLDRRGQYALIRGVVRTRLKPLESLSILAQYGCYQTKGEGILGLTEGLKWRNDFPVELRFDLLCNFYRAGGYARSGRAKPAKTLRTISDAYGVSSSKLYREQMKVREQIRRAELDAYARLCDIFRLVVANEQ